MINPKCKICRRLGTKLFLKGDRCLSPKCAVLRKPYPPGAKSKRRKRGGSEYGKELAEKQKLKNWYNLRERQFRNYVEEVLEKRGQVDDAGAMLLKKFATRLDNVIFRAGITSSRAKAKQLVSHNHFLVNEKKVNVPSYQLKKGDVISISPTSYKKPVFQNIAAVLKKQKFPSWIEVNIEKLSWKIVSDPSVEEILTPPAEISAVFEYYSR